MIFHAHIFSVLKNSPDFEEYVRKEIVMNFEFWLFLCQILHTPKKDIFIWLFSVSSLPYQHKCEEIEKRCSTTLTNQKKCVMLSTIYPVTNFKKCSNKDTLFTLKKVNEKSEIGKRKLAFSVLKASRRRGCVIFIRFVPLKIWSFSDATSYIIIRFWASTYVSTLANV